MTTWMIYALFACFLAGAVLIAVLYVRLLCGKRETLSVCSVALGEVGVKGRIKKALSYKKPMLWVSIACVLLCAVVAVLFLTDPMGEETSDVLSDGSSEVSETIPMGTLLGEGYYLYGEYETEMTFAEVSEQLETLGYRVKYVEDVAPELTFEGEYIYGAVKETHEHVCMYILTCDTAELAKDVYTYWMTFTFDRVEHALNNEPFFFAQSVVRIGNTVYAIMDRGEVPADLFGVCGIPLPAPTPLYSGGVVKADFEMEFDEVITQAQALG
jgi:hypothetical protein